MRTVLAVALLGGAALFSHAAFAQTVANPLSLCTGRAAPMLPANPQPSAASRDVEALLSVSADPVQTADQAIDMLSDAAGKMTDRSPAALAPFCATAGEAYRQGRKGNPFEARALLEAAFRFSERSDQRDIAALAAYRLALVSGSAIDTSSRGFSRRRGLTADAVAARAVAGNAGASEYCDSLTRPVLASDGTIDYDDIRYGDAIYAVGSSPYAVIALHCAVDRATATGDHDLAARAALRMGRLWLDQARRSPAKASRAKLSASLAALAGIRDALRVPDQVVRVELAGRLADIAIDAGSEDPALSVARDALLTGAPDPASHAIAKALAGRIDLARGAKAEAAANFRQAIFLESQAAVPRRLADWYLLLADAEPDHRAADVTLAYRALTAVRPLLPAYDALTQETNFALRIRPVFEAMIENALGPAVSADDAAQIDAVQTVVESYRQAELQSSFGNECVAARPPIRSADLRPGEILLYPILLPDRIELLYAEGAVAGEAPRYHRLPPNRAAGRADVLALMDAMLDGTTIPPELRDRADAWRAPARALYRLLIAPVADRLAIGGTLVIVPDGPLGALPFGALIDEHDHYLLEHSRLAVVPALAYAQPGAARARDLSVVAATLEKRVDVPFGYYDALRGTGVEARAAIGAGSGRGLLIQNFRRADLVHALAHREVDVLHLATHANFNGRSDRSYIVADGELVPITDLRDMIARNETRGDQLDLIVLSACETAVGDDQASMGLAGAAVQAGARSAIASLWQANDAGTAALMTGFYARYGAGAGKAEALRGAELALLAKGGAFADPNVWAAFTLLGGWR